MELPTHPLLCLVEANKAGLKSMLTHYIDATVDSHFNAMKLNIVEMIQTGQIGPQITQVNAFQLVQPLPSNHQNDDSSNACNDAPNYDDQLNIGIEVNEGQNAQVPIDEYDNVKEEYNEDDDYQNCDNDENSESHQNDTQHTETEVSLAALVQPSPSLHQTAPLNASIAPSTLNNSNEHFSTDKITCPPALLANDITTAHQSAPLIKQECNSSLSSTIPINVHCNDAPNDDEDNDYLHHEDEEKDCDCNYCLSEIKEEVVNGDDDETGELIETNQNDHQSVNKKQRVNTITRSLNKNVMDNEISKVNGQIEDSDEFEEEDMSDQVGHVADLSHQVNNISFADHQLTSNTDDDQQYDDGQIGLTQPIDDEQQQPNGQVVTTDNDTQQMDCADGPEIQEVEFEVEQMMMEVKKENEDKSDHDEENVAGDDDTEIDSDSDHGDGVADNIQNENSSRSVDNALVVNATPPQPIRTPTQISIRQSARIATKRKQTHDDEQPLNEVNNRTNQQDTDGDKEDDQQEEVTLRSVKRPRTSCPTTSNSSTKKSQIIIHKLQCSQCNKMFAQDKFSAHMWDSHSIRQVPCLVKDCKQSFDTKSPSQNFHQSITEWHCDKCENHFSSYHDLSVHKREYHQIGKFQCSFPRCKFTGEYRRKVFTHYATHNHNLLTVKKCTHPGCTYETTKSSSFKAHERVHLDSKPYRCKWSQCGYSSATRSNTLRHIRSSHLKDKVGNCSSSGTTRHSTDPTDYLEVLL